MTPLSKIPNDSLLRLPNELLLHIRDDLGFDDLLGHASYYQLHPRTQACYAAYDDDPQFWIALLFENGLTVSSCETDTSGIAWRNAALECAEHARTCVHPACGMQRIEANRQRLQDKRKLSELQHWDGLSPLSHERACDSAAQISSSPLLEYIGFNSEFPSPYSSEKTRSTLIGLCAFLRNSPEDDDGWLPSDLLGGHPVASRSFATFPPVQTFLISDDILDSDDDMDVKNPHGVTVHDTLTALSTILGRNLDEEQIETLVDFGTWPAYDYVQIASDWHPRAFPRGWPLGYAYRAANRAGSVFQIHRWTGFHVNAWDGTLFAFLTFEPKTLPTNVWFHAAKYKYPKTLLGLPGTNIGALL